MNKGNIKNWKLIEVIDDIEVIDELSQKYINRILKEFQIPLTQHTSINRKFTQIDWENIDKYNKFFLDKEGEEEINQKALQASKLADKDNLIITYGWNEPTIKISTQKFIDEWEDFIASTHWETIIFSDDFELIIEVSRDYNLHSNFKIR